MPLVVREPLTTYNHMMSWNCAVIVSGNGLLPGLFDAKPIPDSMLVYCQYFPLGKSFQEISNQIIKKSRSRKYMQNCSLQSVGHASKDLVVQPGNAHDLQVAIYEIQGPWYRHESRRLGVDTTITWDVMKWKHFPRYWPFVRGIHRSPVDPPHKGKWRGSLMFYLIKRLSKRSIRRLFETPSRSSWRHCNGMRIFGLRSSNGRSQWLRDKMVGYLNNLGVNRLKRLFEMWLLMYLFDPIC